MGKLKAMFDKVGGKEILRQYGQAHIFLFAVMEVLLLGVSKKALEILRLATTYKKMKKLSKKYKRFIGEFKEKHKNDVTEKSEKPSEYIWICWFQGMDNAPPIVQKCYQSVCQNIQHKKIVLINKDNYADYVQMPDYIVEKHEKGIIGAAHFADLLRVELLLKYGGTWIDSTVLCTSENVPSYMLDSELFLFRTLKPGMDGHPTSISNWYITAQKNNIILRLTLELLYEYWRKNNKLIDYFIFHIFFEIAIQTYPEQWAKTVPFSNELPHILLLRLFEEYDEEMFQAITAQTCFHKLTYKISDSDAQKTSTYFSHILNDTNKV